MLIFMMWLAVGLPYLSLDDICTTNAGSGSKDTQAGQVQGSSPQPEASSRAVLKASISLQPQVLSCVP